jgi:PAS domain S-box-containing protein
VTRFELDEATLLELLAAVPEVVLLIGADRTVHFLNQEVAGYRPEDTIGTDALTPIPNEALVERDEMLERAFTTMQPLEIRNNELAGPDGRREWYDSTLIPLVRDGRTEYMVIVSRNVTERVLAERERAVLERILTMCAWCGKVHGEDGIWQTLDAYVERTTDESVTRGLCPACESATGAGG